MATTVILLLNVKARSVRCAQDSERPQELPQLRTPVPVCWSSRHWPFFSPMPGAAVLLPYEGCSSEGKMAQAPSCPPAVGPCRPGPARRRLPAAAAAPRGGTRTSAPPPTTHSMLRAVRAAVPPSAVRADRLLPVRIGQWRWGGAGFSQWRCASRAGRSRGRVVRRTNGEAERQV